MKITNHKFFDILCPGTLTRSLDRSYFMSRYHGNGGTFYVAPRHGFASPVCQKHTTF